MDSWHCGDGSESDVGATNRHTIRHTVALGQGRRQGRFIEIPSWIWRRGEGPGRGCVAHAGGREGDDPLSPCYGIRAERVRPCASELWAGVRCGIVACDLKCTGITTVPGTDLGCIYCIVAATDRVVPRRPLRSYHDPQCPG